MALTNAEKQQRYRERHLGLDGAKQRGLYFLSVQAKAQLGCLARYKGYSVTANREAGRWCRTEAAGSARPEGSKDVSRQQTGASKQAIRRQKAYKK